MTSDPIRQLADAWKHCAIAAHRAGVQTVIQALKQPIACILSNLDGRDSFAERLAECAENIKQLAEVFEQMAGEDEAPTRPELERLTQLRQAVGELEFAAIASTAGAAVKPVQTLNQQHHAKKPAPDFVLMTDSNVFFEVKTLGRAETAGAQVGDSLLALLNEAHLTHRQMNARLRQGARVVTACTVDQPYADNPYRKGAMRGLVETLSLKIRSNVKPAQFERGQTFLVVNLLDLPLYASGPEQLRPVYFEKALPVPAPTSGALWMTAFARPGMLWFFPPEFEGCPGIEGSAKFNGVLYEKPFVAGILWIVHTLDAPSQSMLTLRAADNEAYRRSDETIWRALYSLAGSNWNDELDTNGWRLRG